MERVLAFKKVLKFELCLPPKKVSGTSALTWVSSGGQCHMEVLLPQQLNSMAAPWRDLATSGSRWYILRSLCVPKGGNQTSQGAILEAAFQTAPVISSMFTACFATHLNQSFWSLQGKKKKQKTPIYIELLSCIGTELQSALLTGKCQRKTPPVFLELRAGITPVALGVPSAWCPRVLPCSSPSIPWLGIKFCANILDELINKAVEVVKFIHKEGMLLIGVCCDGFQFILGCPSNSHGVSYNSWKETQSLEWASKLSLH